MSSTNRGGGVYIRHEDDFYETPAWAVRALLPHLGDTPQSDPAFCTALDPCCGNGAILNELRAYGVSGTFGIEIDAGRASECKRRKHPTSCCDALQSDWPKTDAIITNPPFFLALEFLQKALRECYVHGTTVAFLLRLNFLGSKKRAAFHREHPARVLIFPERPSFRTDGKTDSIEYAWYLWGPEIEPGTWQILETNKKGQ